MSHSIPPPIPMPAAERKRRMVAILVVLVCVFAFIAIWVSASVARSISNRVKEMTEVHLRLKADKFRITILEVKRSPDYFRERVRVSCDHDMDAGIWVTDLKQAGLFESSGADGETFYREGHPYKAGQSARVSTTGDLSTCDILMTVNTTLTNTAWHSEITTILAKGSSHSEDSNGVDTTLRLPMTVSGVRTNWAGSYPRGSGLPLANLGDYKILLLIK